MSENKNVKRVEVTKESLKKLYDECNKEYFNNELKNCKLSVLRNYKTCGCIAQCVDTKKNGKLFFRIWIVARANWTEQLLKEVMIHEMIHQYNIQIDKVRFHGFWHGWKFRKKQRELNKKFNLNLKISNPELYRDDEKIPSTSFGKLMRYIRVNLLMP